MTNVSESKKFMTKPLPEILDEFENSIRLANEAAQHAKEAAAEVRKAGEKAIKDAIDVVNERIYKVEQISNDAMQLVELLRSAVVDGVAAINGRLSEKVPDIESAPKK